MRLSTFLLGIALLGAVGACKSGGEMGELVGADRDEHGCIGSAGYTWSHALHQCVRLWEAGTRFEAGQQSAFLIYSADSAYAEVFPQTGDAVVCRRDKEQPNRWVNKRKRADVSIQNGVTRLRVGGTTYVRE